MIDLLMIKSKTFDSIIVNSLTIELMASLAEKSIELLIKSSVKMLIEAFIAFKAFVIN